MSGLLALLRAVLMPVILAVLGAATLAPLLFLGATDLQSAARYRPDGGDAPVTPLSNLAATALFRAGFVRIAPTYDEAEGDEAPSETTWQTVRLPHVCTGDPLVKALVAAEVFMRPAWRRQFELALGEAWFAVGGRPPDWSYGMAQIRLATAREAILAAQARYGGFLGQGGAPELSDRGLLDALSDPCDAIRIATLVLDAGRPVGETAAAAAARYRGGTARQALPAAVTYERMVTEMADRLLPAFGYGTSLALLPNGPNETPFVSIRTDQPPPSPSTEPPPDEAAPSAPLRPFACVERDMELFSSALLLPADESGSAPVERISVEGFRAALAQLDPAGTDLILLTPDPGDASLASLAFLAEIDAIGLPGLLSLPWRSVERRIVPVEEISCDFLALAADPPSTGFRAAVTTRARAEARE